MRGGNGDIKRMQLYDKPKDVAPETPIVVVDDAKKAEVVPTVVSPSESSLKAA